MRRYLLLNNEKNVMQKIFCNMFRQLKIHYLFDNTILSIYKEKGPIFIEDSTATKEDLCTFLKENSGLLINSQYTSENVLNQLRKILIVYFNDKQQGVLRYYDTKVASYFFPSLLEKEVGAWLGVIDSIEWFDISWKEVTTEESSWKYCKNLEKTLAVNGIYRLDKHHIKALENMQKQKVSYHWYSNKLKNKKALTVQQVSSLVDEAALYGFYELAEIEQYLEIRINHLNKSLPESWLSGNSQEKLAFLKQYYSQNIN
ncbi:DUF4123 domain-containing protein [Entomomonas asaccharolytica]|uniref:DUF4123 domain-containing protein n=1 Tax=Entomomonas asaccharolytica TaxID=2785331 RepID=A0A974ND32_9GAMM|nr:DUF4123 domain-containing protein [Entomomonas asaccharolytica]QQP84536.1 DUF4123 domain-containing protein [Entomomonas asaccharolytica]